MKPALSTSKAALGFLTVLDDPQHGLFGGYLILNPTGRPLEFHCTAPVRPNRAQQILYGPTLEPFLYGEQIGQTLWAKAKTSPIAVCTDREPMLAVGEHVDVPVALVLSGRPTPEAGDETPDAGTVYRIDTPHGPRPGLITFELGSNRLAVSEARAQDRPYFADRVAPVVGTLDLAEPFGRIREAIEEARRGGHAA